MKLQKFKVNDGIKDEIIECLTIKGVVPSQISSYICDGDKYIPIKEYKVINEKKIK